MASEIFDVGGNATGTQAVGHSVVSTNGKAEYKVLDNRPPNVDIDISTITDSFDERCGDHPRYYAGDAVT
jgi:hypothetical protein